MLRFPGGASAPTQPPTQPPPADGRRRDGVDDASPEVDHIAAQPSASPPPNVEASRSPGRRNDLVFVQEDPQTAKNALDATSGPPRRPPPPPPRGGADAGVIAKQVQISPPPDRPPPASPTSSRREIDTVLRGGAELADAVAKTPPSSDPERGSFVREAGEIKTTRSAPFLPKLNLDLHLPQVKRGLGEMSPRGRDASFESSPTSPDKGASSAPGTPRALVRKIRDKLSPSHLDPVPERGETPRRTDDRLGSPIPPKRGTVTFDVEPRETSILRLDSCGRVVNADMPPEENVESGAETDRREAAKHLERVARALKRYLDDTGALDHFGEAWQKESRIIFLHELFEYIDSENPIFLSKAVDSDTGAEEGLALREVLDVCEPLFFKIIGPQLLLRADKLSALATAAAAMLSALPRIRMTHELTGAEIKRIARLAFGSARKMEADDPQSIRRLTKKLVRFEELQTSLTSECKHDAISGFRAELAENFIDPAAVRNIAFASVEALHAIEDLNGSDERERLLQSFIERRFQNGAVGEEKTMAEEVELFKSLLGDLRMNSHRLYSKEYRDCLCEMAAIVHADRTADSVAKRGVVRSLFVKCLASWGIAEKIIELSMPMPEQVARGARTNSAACSFGAFVGIMFDLAADPATGSEGFPTLDVAKEIDGLLADLMQ